MKNREADLPELVIKGLSIVAVFVMIFMFLFVFSKSMPVILSSGVKLFTTKGFDLQISEAFNAPVSAPVMSFGMLGLIAGTVISTAFSLVVASFFGIGAAIAICELVPKQAAAVLVTFVRLLASIPSVVFGLIGLITVVPIVEKLFVTPELQLQYLNFFQMSGRNLLSSIIVLSFMIMLTIISLTVDAIRAVPHHYKEAGFAMGMAHFRVILKIMLPAARSGILAGVILGAGRGIGEAIAVSMVCGSLGMIPDFTQGFVGFLSPVLPLAAAIINKSEAMSVPAVSSALFTCGAILLVISALLSVSARVVEGRMRRLAGYDD